MEILKKITARTVGCKTEPGQSFILFGRVSRVTNGSSQYGEFLVYRGQFQAMNEQTKEEFTSTQAIAPAVGEDMVYNAVRAAQEDDKNATVDIAMRFATVEVDRTKAPMGYEWRCKPLLEPVADDPVTRLRATVMKQISAPEKTTEKKSA